MSSVQTLPVPANLADIDFQLVPGSSDYTDEDAQESSSNAFETDGSHSKFQ